MNWSYKILIRNSRGGGRGSKPIRIYVVGWQGDDPAHKHATKYERCVWREDNARATSRVEAIKYQLEYLLHWGICWERFVNNYTSGEFMLGPHELGRKFPGYHPTNKFD